MTSMAGMQRLRRFSCTRAESHFCAQCDSLACIGGIAGECNDFEGPWSHKVVSCAGANGTPQGEKLRLLNERFRTGRASDVLSEAGVIVRQVVPHPRGIDGDVDDAADVSGVQ